MPVRSNWLNVLSDLAENNNQTANNAKSDSINQINFSVLGIVSTFSHIYFVEDPVRNTINQCFSFVPSVFSKINTPPPKSS